MGLFSMYYWELWVDHGKRIDQYGKEHDLGYFVYYKTPMESSPESIPKIAVRDGDLGDWDMDCVAYALEITPEEYFNKMLE